jgi:hypothetical protein
MRLTLTIAFLASAFFVFSPSATASPCDVGDTDNVCLQDVNNGFGSTDCTEEGAQYHWSSASVSAAGETVTAYGLNSCNHEPGYGFTNQGPGVFYSGSQGWVQANYFGSSDTNGNVECGIFVQNIGPVNNGAQFIYLPDEVCLPYGSLPWGSLIP